MIAKHPGTCPRCGKAIHLGESIGRAEDIPRWVHYPECAKKPTQNSSVLINSYFDAKPAHNKSYRFRTRNKDVLDKLRP